MNLKQDSLQIASQDDRAAYGRGVVVIVFSVSSKHLGSCLLAVGSGRSCIPVVLRRSVLLDLQIELPSDTKASNGNT